jgi:hypothetical protein
MAFQNVVVARAAASIWGLKLGYSTTQSVLDQLNSGASLNNVINAAFNDSYAGMSDAAVAAMVVGNLGLSGQAATDATALVVANIAGNTTTRGSVLAGLVNQFSLLTADATYGAAARAFNDKVNAAATYAGTVGTADAVIGDVPSGTSFNLTLGQDSLTATPGDDTFSAWIFDNQNTWQSGDWLDGGAGAADRLNAELGSSANFAILPKVRGVEQIYIKSQSTDANGSSGDNAPDGHTGQMVTVDADSIVGVRQLWSTNSRADLKIEDVRVNSHLTTLGFQSADPGDIDYNVYFSPRFITAPDADTSGATVRIELIDVLGLAEAQNPFRDLKFTGIVLDIGTTRVTLDVNVSAATSYTDLAARINAELVAKGFGTVTATALAPETAQFPIAVTSNGITYDRGSVAGSYQPLVLSNSGPASVLVFDYVRAANFNPSAVLVTTQTPNPASQVPSLTQVNMVLDDVGRGSKSGDFMAGNHSTGASGSVGIQQFNVDVDRTSWITTLSTTNNGLEVVNIKNIGANGNVRISETDNVLWKAATDGTSGLGTIGGIGLSDVRVVDASTMVGTVNVSAALSGGVVSKYLNLRDTQENPAADNSETPFRNVTDIEFSYDLGRGNDTLTLQIDDNNLETNGTTTREDFELTVMGGDGNDTITLAIVDSVGTSPTAAAVAVTATAVPVNANVPGGATRTQLTYTDWYDNHSLLDNVEIIAGNGNDTVRTPGSGDVIISLGAGADTAYVDNIGEKGIFVFNTVDKTAGATEVEDLESGANDSYKIHGGTLTFSFLGFEVTVPLVHTRGTVTDLQINQTLKTAINGNAQMSKLLQAQDGPANTLVVRSLIDGDLDAVDLTITLKAPTLTDLTPARVNQINQDYRNTTTQTAAQLIADMESQIASFVTKGDYATTFSSTSTTDGADAGALSVSDNRVDAGTDADTIVLGTGTHSNDTVVYTGYGNGTDWVVNFDDSWVTAGATVYTGTTALTERIRVTFSASDGDPVAQGISFDGTNIVLSAPATQGVIPAADVAFQFVTLFDPLNANWNVTSYTQGSATVELTRVVAGVLTDVVPADFTGTYFTGGAGTVSVATTRQGTDAITVGTQSAFTVDFDMAGTAADAAGSFVFDGVTVNYAEGDGSLSLAIKLAAATFPNWTTARTDDSVTFTAKAPGATAIGLAADFDIGTNTIVGAIGGVVGTANAGTPIATFRPAGPDFGFDYIDFSSYKPQGVVVDGAIIKGILPTTGIYIRMVESTTNKGMYTIDEINLGATAATTDDVAPRLIGVIDFGETQVFRDVTFIT